MIKFYAYNLLRNLSDHPYLKMLLYNFLLFLFWAWHGSWSQADIRKLLSHFSVKLTKDETASQNFTRVTNISYNKKLMDIT